MEKEKVRKVSIKKKIIKYFLIICLFTFSFWYLFKDFDSFDEFQDSLNNMKYGFIAIAFLMVILQIFIQGLCYTAMSYKLNDKETPCKVNPIKGFLYCGVDLFFSQITPFAVGGQPVMVATMKKKDNLPVSKTTTMALLYSFLNKIALIILAIIAAVLYWNNFFANDNHNALMVILLIVGVISNILIASSSLIFMALGGFVYKVGSRLIFWLFKHKLLKSPYDKCKKFHIMINNFKKSNAYVKKHFLLVLAVLGLCILKRIATFLVAYFVYKAFGLSEYGIVYIICAQTVYALVSDSFPIPGGIGAAETAIKELYDNIYPATIADAAAVMVRFISYYGLIIISGATTIVVFSLKNKNNTGIELEDFEDEELPNECIESNQE